MPLSAKRLKRILDHRERLERLQEGQLAAAARRRDERAAALKDTETRREEIFAAGAPAAGRLDALELHTNALAIIALEREALARSSALAHSEREVERERDVMLERRRDRKAMETLLDRRLEAERRERLRSEALRLDELAGIRWTQATREREATHERPRG